MIQRAEVLKLFKHEIDKKNKHIGKSEQIRKFYLLPDEWTVMTGELTPTLKLRRNYVMEKYKGMIEQLFDTNSFNDKKTKTDSLMDNSTSPDENG
jgi:long-chain acyl-CoA synthetase